MNILIHMNMFIYFFICILAASPLASSGFAAIGCLHFEIDCKRIREFFFENPIEFLSAFSCKIALTFSNGEKSGLLVGHIPLAH